jgi:hypothetical protein
VPYSSPGKRISATGGNGRTIVHGKPAVWNGIAGIAMKVAQLGTFVDPAAAAATQIAATETFELDVQGVHELTREGNLATADIGAAAVSHIYINSANDTVGLAAQGLAAAVLNAGWLPLGIVIERDPSRTPQVLRVDLDLRDLVRGNWP